MVMATSTVRFVEQYGQLKLCHQEPNATVYCGHALGLKELPAESVDMCMTSPPYWGLRSYKTEPQIWDSQDGCVHEWQIKTIVSNPQSWSDKSGLWADNRPEESRQKTILERAQRNRGVSTYQQGFCTNCGAWYGELGLEPTIELYISHLIQIFNEVKRVLKKTGTCWVVIDDSYASGKGTCFNPGGGKGSFSSHGDRKDSGVYPLDRGNISMLRAEGLLPKSLCLIPSRFALAMVENGWILRNDICWNKPNPMPESVKDRFTGSWEHLFFFTKNNQALYWTNSKTFKITGKQPPGTHGVENEDWEWIEHSACGGKGCNNKHCVNGKIKSSLWEGHDYWFEQQFDEYTEPLNRWGGDSLKRDTSKTTEYKDMMNIGYSSAFRVGRPMRPNELGRNKRDVWGITTSPYPEAHFATFPEKLCETPILAGCPDAICRKCGKARERIYERTGHINKREPAHQPGNTPTKVDSTDWGPTERPTTEYTDCGCNAGFEPGVVLDPCCGRGTTLIVAKKLGRKAIGIDLNPNYCKLTVKGLQEIAMPMALV